VSEVEAEQVECFVIDDEHLAVIAHQIARSASDGNAFSQQPHFETAQVLFFALVGVGNEGLNGHAATHGVEERLFDFNAIETEDQNTDTFSGFSKCVENGLDAIVWLYQQLHSVSP